MSIHVFFLLFSFLLAPDSEAGISENAAYSSRAFHSVLLRCPERVWPGMSWQDLQFLFSDPENKYAWLVSSASPTPEVVRKDQTLEDIFEPGFKHGFLDFRGLRTVAVNIEGLTEVQSFRLAVHQLFKEIAQSDWENPEYDDRGTLYPLLPEPRYLRRMAFESLRKAYLAISRKQNPSGHLSAAAWWNQRWRKAYPEELPMRTDSLEGTALYAEQMAYLFAESGCHLRGKGFFEAFLKHLEPELHLYSENQLPLEGMELGSLSSFLLTSLSPGWHSKMNGRVMPSDLVLEGVRPVAQPEDLNLRDTYKTIVGGQQKQAYKKLSFTLKKEKNNSYVRVSIPALWQKGSLGVDLSYVLRARLDATLLIFEEKHDFSGETGLIRIPSQAVVFQTDRNDCGGVFHFLMPSHSITQNGNRFTGVRWRHRFDFEGTRKTSGGFTWICPRE